jgi:ribonuclease P/MRP protein subunit POP7
MDTPPERLPRIAGKHIKHGPSSNFKYSDLQTTVHIHKKTPYISAVKRVDKMLRQLSDKQPRRTYITVLGMGAAIEKTINVGVHFQSIGCQVDILTKTVEVLDEFENDDDSVLRKRKVSAIEVRVHKPMDLE